MFRAIAVGLLVVAVACAALAIYWLAVKSTFLASHYGHQPKHALVAGVVAVVALIAASIVWRQGRRPPDPGRFSLPPAGAPQLRRRAGRGSGSPPPETA